MKNKKALSKIYCKNNKGQGHIEVILSFIIFIGFLLFVFIFMNPFASTRETSYIMENIQKSIINNISEDIGKLSIITNGTSCYEFTKANYDGDYLEIDQGNGKFIIYFNNMFSDTQTKKGGCELNYTLGTYSKEELVVYEKIVELKSNYEASYDNLKTNLGITNNFVFKTKDLVGNEINETSVEYAKIIPQGVNIEARDIPIRVININGQIQELILNIKAW